MYLYSVHSLSNPNSYDINIKRKKFKTMNKIDDKKKISSAWFKELRDKICQELEKFEISAIHLSIVLFLLIG